MTDGGPVIIVGAGLAGGAAALALARAGGHPLLVDPQDGSAGDAGGSGILSSQDVPPDLRDRFPIERLLRDRRLAFLGRESSVALEFQEPTGGGAPSSFLRERTDRWLADAVVAAGGELAAGHVDGLIRSGSGVGGIVLDGTPRPASLTILADGSTATGLAESLVPGGPLGGEAVATIASERWALPARRIAERFDLPDGGGCSLHAVLGAAPAPEVASGFLVTQRDSLTVGVRVLGPTGTAASRLGSFRSHASIAPFLEGASPTAGSARTTMPRPRRTLTGPGWILAGDAAGLPAFHGSVLRGRNRAFRSGWRAGEESARSVHSGRPGGRYAQELRRERVVGGGPSSEDPVIGDPRIHGAYPDLLAAAFHRIMTETGRPKEPVSGALRAIRRSSHRTWPALLRDASGALRRL